MFTHSKSVAETTEAAQFGVMTNGRVGRAKARPFFCFGPMLDPR